MSVQLDPKYLSENKDEVERILASVKTIDAAPTAGSNNPVKSGGVAAALGDYNTKEEVTELLAGKQDTMTEAPEEEIRGIVKNWSPDSHDDSSDSEDSE